jgi:polyisoprenoid-binding protein YceI
MRADDKERAVPVFTRRLALGLIAATVVLAAPLAAQMDMPKPGARDSTRITGGTYAVDPYHTMVGWRVDHMGITPYFGMFGDVTGTMVLDPKHPAAAKVDISIPVAKVTTASAELTQHLLKAPEKPDGEPDFFGPSPAPARFVSTSVVPDAAAGKARITGNLTLNGVTKPVTLDASFHGAGKGPKEMGGVEMVGFEAKATIKRSDFGISMGIPIVSDEVDLDIVAAFTKE